MGFTDQPVQELNARSESGSFSNVSSLASLEAEVKSRRQKRFLLRRRKWLSRSLAGIFVVIILSGVGFGTYKFFNSRWVRQPADLFSIQNIKMDIADLDVGVAKTPFPISALGLNGDLVIGGNLSLSQRGVEDLAQNLTNKLNLQTNFPGIVQKGNINITGTVGAVTFVGSGEQVNDLNASSIDSGALHNNRLDPDVSLLGQSISATQIQPNIISSVNRLVGNSNNIELVGAGGISVSTTGGVVQINSALADNKVGEIIVGSGLMGGGVSSPVNVGLDNMVTIQGNTFNGANQLVQLDGGGLIPVLDGSLLTNIDASALASGTINTARLSANILYKDTATNILIPTSDSTSAFSVRTSSDSVDVLNVDTQNLNVSIGYPAATVNNYRLNINGDINVEPPISTLLIGGAQICGSLTCIMQDGNSNYIQNSTTLQTGNIAIQTAGFSTTSMRLKALAGQTSNLIHVEDSNQSSVLRVRSDASGQMAVWRDFTIQSDSTSALLVQNMSLVNDVMRVDTTNNRVGMGQLAGNLPAYTLDVNGDANLDASSSMRIDGVALCDVMGCTSDGATNSYINNQTATQTANLSVQSVHSASVTSVVQGAVAQAADILRVENVAGAVVQVSPTGDFLQKTTVNSGSAFAVVDSLSSKVLEVSTSDNRVNVGGGTLSARLGVLASSTDVGQIIDNSGSGQSLQVKKSSTDVFTVADTGDTAIQPSANTASAVTVANATGGSILQVGSGYSSTSSTPSLVFNGANVGEVSGWTTNVTNMNKPLRDAGYVYLNGYMYRMGGTQQISRTAFNLESEVARAPVNPDGSVGSWTVIGDLYNGGLWAKRAGLGVTGINGAIHVVGGYRFNSNTTNLHNGTEFSVVRGDGSISSWAAINSLSACCDAQRAEAPLVSDGYGNMYYLGGTTNYGSSPLSGIYRETIRGNLHPSWGSWPHNSNISALPGGRAGHSALIANGYLYAVGGYAGSSGGSVQSTVYYAKLNGTGGAGSWSTANAMPAGLKYHCSGVVNGYLYVWGGDTGAGISNAIYYAKLNTNGSLGSWQTSTQTLPVAVASSGCAVINGRLYSFGGVTSGGVTTDAVYYAEISKVRVYADLDLIGLDNTNFAKNTEDSNSRLLSGASRGGDLSAGMIYAKGNLQATGSSQLAGGLAVLDKLSVGGDTIINIVETSTPYPSRFFAVDNSDGARVLSIDAFTNGETLGVNEGGVGQDGGINAKMTARNAINWQTIMRVTDSTSYPVDVMTIEDTGPTTFKSQTASTTALSVQNASMTELFSVDTIDAQVVVGSASTAVNIHFNQGASYRSAITRNFVCTATEAVNDIVAFNGVDTVTQTSTANSSRVAGVVVSKPNSTTCTTAIYGVVQVNFGANATPATIGDPVVTSAIAGAAQSTITPSSGALLGNSTSSKDGSNLVWVRLRRD